MRAFTTALILFSMALCAEPRTACASPLLLHALSDSELADNCAGGAVEIQFRETAQDNQTVMTGLDIDLARNLFGVETVRHDSGPASFTQAITAIAVRATLTGNGL